MNRIFIGLMLIMPVLSCSDGTGNSNERDPGQTGNPETVYVKEEGSIRLVAYNVGAFSKEMTDSAPVIASMMKEIYADAMVLNELDRNNERHDYDQLARFAGYMDWDCWFGKAMDYRGGEYGNGAAYSKDLKVVDRFVISMPKDTGSEDRSCVVVEFDDFVLAGTHLEVKTEEDRLSGIRTITETLAGKYGDSAFPLIEAGHLFQQCPSPSYVNICIEHIR